MPAPLADELDRIAERVAALTRLVHALRDENQSLRATLDQRERDNKGMRERLDVARERVESLIARIPTPT